MKPTDFVSNLSPEQVDDLLETISDAFYALDQDARFTYLNPSAERLWGKSRSELLGRNIWEVFPQAVGSEHHQAHLRASTQLHPVKYETLSPIIGRWVEVTIYPSGFGLSVCFHDITSRKQAEAALDRSEALLTHVFQVAPVAAVISSLDNDGILDVNAAFESLTGYSRDKAVGRTCKALGLWSSSEDQAKLRQAEDGPGSMRDLELKIRTSSGLVRDVLASGTRLEQDGQKARLRMFHDITERKRDETQILQAIQEALQDSGWFFRLVMEKLASIRSNEGSGQDLVSLTPRELAVLERVARGLTNEAIAADLSLTRQTVRNYVANIYRKIGTSSRAEAIIWARERGMGVL